MVLYRVRRQFGVMPPKLHALLMVVAFAAVMTSERSKSTGTSRTVVPLGFARRKAVVG